MKTDSAFEIHAQVYRSQHRSYNIPILLLLFLFFFLQKRNNNNNNNVIKTQLEKEKMLLSSILYFTNLLF